MFCGFTDNRFRQNTRSDGYCLSVTFFEKTLIVLCLWTSFCLPREFFHFDTEILMLDHFVWFAEQNKGSLSRVTTIGIFFSSQPTFSDDRIRPIVTLLL